MVIPTLNEARNLPHVLAQVPEDVHEIIIVDGHSVDDTLAVARQARPNVRIAMQTRRGKGNAVACGFEIATGDIVAIIDADGSADPRELPRFVDALLAGADYAKGTRFAHGGGSSDITRLRSLGNRGLCTLVNILFGTKYTDLCYGFVVLWKRIVPVLGMDPTGPQRVNGDGMSWGDGFEIDTLLNIRVATEGLVVAEVPSFEHSRLHGVSNLNAYADGMRVLRTILTERRRSRSGGTKAVQRPHNYQPASIVELPAPSANGNGHHAQVPASSVASPAHEFNSNGGGHGHGVGNDGNGSHMTARAAEIGHPPAE